MNVYQKHSQAEPCRKVAHVEPILLRRVSVQSCNLGPQLALLLFVKLDSASDLFALAGPLAGLSVAGGFQLGEQAVPTLCALLGCLLAHKGLSAQHAPRY